MSLLDAETSLINNTGIDGIINSKFPKFEDVSNVTWNWGTETYQYVWDDETAIPLLKRFEGLNIPSEKKITRNKYSIANIDAMYGDLKKIIVSYSYQFPRWKNVDTKYKSKSEYRRHVDMKKYWIVSVYLWFDNSKNPDRYDSEYKINILEFKYPKKEDAKVMAYQLLEYLKENPTVITKLAIIDSIICRDMESTWAFPIFIEFKDIKNNKLEKTWKNYSHFY